MNRSIASHEGTNGASSDGAAAAYMATAFDDDPMSKVLGLDAKTSSLAAWFGFTSGGTLLAAVIIALASVVAWLHTSRAQASSVEEIEVIPNDPPPPPPPVAEPQPEPEAKPAAPQPRVMHEAPPPPPPPAQAAKVLTQAPDPNEPVDLTGNTIVQGNADTYAGGFTAANGTSANAVRSMAGPTGVAGGTGPVQPQVQQRPVGPDLSRKASLAGAGEWRCPFPPEADTAQIDEAWVTLQADVGADGTPGQVRVLRDPGNGFGREARRCAMNRRWTTALDHDGNPVAGTTGPVTVHFTR